MEKKVMDNAQIKRGDRTDTGPERARHKDGVGRAGSGVAGGDGGATGHVTGSSDAMAEPVDRLWLEPDDIVASAEDLEDFTITDADDPNLGLTGVEGHPPEDWAANTGPSRNLDADDEDVVAPPEEPPPSRRRK
jgi:hypothetical protein